MMAFKADVDLAVAAAKKAFSLGSEWRKLEPSARGKLINKYNKIKFTSFRTLQNYIYKITG